MNKVVTTTMNCLCMDSLWWYCTMITSFYRVRKQYLAYRRFSLHKISLVDVYLHRNWLFHFFISNKNRMNDVLHWLARMAKRETWCNETAAYFMLKYVKILTGVSCLIYYSWWYTFVWYTNCSPLQNNNRTSTSVVARQTVTVHLYSPFILWVLNIRTWRLKGRTNILFKIWYLYLRWVFI